MNEWMDFFRDTHKKAFSLSDLILLTGERRSSISVQLSRLVNSGLIRHPARGCYLNPFRPPSNEELAMILRHPSYLSMEYALTRHGILSQDVFVYTLVTTRLPREFHACQAFFEYHQVKRTLFWGYVQEKGVLIAEPEKALLDLIYIRFAKRGGLEEGLLRSLADDMDLAEMDIGKLRRHSAGFSSATRAILSKELGVD